MIIITRKGSFVHNMLKLGELDEMKIDWVIMTATVSLQADILQLPTPLPVAEARTPFRRLLAHFQCFENRALICHIGVLCFSPMAFKNTRAN